MRHFTDVELQRWCDSGPGRDRERVVAHLAECAACASRYASAIRMSPLAADAAVDVEELVSAGYRAGHDRAGVPPVWTKPWVLSLAAAAVVAIAIVIVTPRMFHREEAPSTPSVRGGAVYTLSPAGTVDRRNVTFVWSTGLSAGRFRIDIGDGAGVIYTAEAAASPWTMPVGLQERLRSGSAYWWTVTVLDGSGGPVISSERRTFVLAGP